MIAEIVNPVGGSPWLLALKKSVSLFVTPLPVCLALLVAGIVLARFARGRWAGRGRACVVAAAMVILLFANTGISLLLVAPLEDRYPAVPDIPPGAPLPRELAACRYVVVLGSGNGDREDLPALSDLADAGLGRLTEAVRLMRLLPGARLIVSGPGYPGYRTHASVLAAAARSLGVDPRAILLIEDGHDTEEEARSVRAIVGGARIALVTSACHMPRAAELFRRAGVDFAPCPADYITRNRPGLHLADLNWDAESLERSSRALHEHVGRLWLWIRP